jgi:3-methyladenine DNA glycosylase AlkD
MSATRIVKRLKSLGTPDKAELLSGFFKTGKGQYGEGDRFLGVIMPEQRKIAKEFRELPFPEIEKLLSSPYHEARMTGLLILTYAYERADVNARQAIYDFLFAHRGAMNNWDLVDVIVPKIIGEHLLTCSKNHSSPSRTRELPLKRGAGKRWGQNGREILHRFAQSDNLWERRVSIVSTAAFIRADEFDDTLSICETLLGDGHDLIHKATGWMLREVGKRDESALRAFLDAHVTRMPRTMLRYAIERFSEGERRRYLAMR